MYMAQSRFGAARARYQNVDLTSRIEGASPHALVAILFESC
jgi:flagellar protein FliS